MCAVLYLDGTGEVCLYFVGDGVKSWSRDVIDRL